MVLRSPVLLGSLPPSRLLFSPVLHGVWSYGVEYYFSPSLPLDTVVFCISTVDY